MFMKVLWHGYDSEMTVLCSPLQIRCYQLVQLLSAYKKVYIWHIGRMRALRLQYVCCIVHMSRTRWEDDVESSVIPSGEGVQMSETDFTCSPVCLSESVTYCQGSLLTQGWCCPQGYVLPCVWERSRVKESEVPLKSNTLHFARNCCHNPANGLHGVRLAIMSIRSTSFKAPETWNILLWP